MLSQNAVKWLLLTTYLYRPWTCLFQTLQICENRDVSEALNRACIIEETSKEENVTEDMSDRDYQSCEKDKALTGSNSDQTVEGKAQSNMNTTSNTDTSHRIEGSEGDCTDHEVIGGVTLLHPHYTSPIGRIDPEPPPVRASTEFPVTQRFVSVKELADVSDDLGRKVHIGKFDSVIQVLYLPSQKWTLVSHLIEPVENQEANCLLNHMASPACPISLPLPPISLTHSQKKLRQIPNSLIKSEFSYLDCLQRGTVSFNGFMYSLPNRKWTLVSVENNITRSIYFRILTYLLKQKQEAAADQMNICGLLLKPVQRFPQLILILKNLLKGADTAKGCKVVNARFRGLKS